MIDSITITDLTKAISESHRKHSDKNLWITLIDPEEQRRVMNMRRRFAGRNVIHYIQYFLDYSDEDVSSGHIPTATLESLGPKKSHVADLISFLDTYIKKEEKFNLGINCMAGISRSTATGLIAWVMLGRSPEEALKEILKVRPMAWPNLRMLGFASELLDIDIKNPVANWKIAQKGKLIY